MQDQLEKVPGDKKQQPQLPDVLCNIALKGFLQATFQTDLAGFVWF